VGSPLLAELWQLHADASAQHAEKARQQAEKSQNPAHDSKTTDNGFRQDDARAKDKRDESPM
jgi:hypothetical protein